MAPTTNISAQSRSESEPRIGGATAPRDPSVSSSPPSAGEMARPIQHPAGASPLRRLLSEGWLVVRRSVLWSYERGTWQYDLIVLAILAFIFLSPRGWFSDRPTLELSNLRHQQGIVELSRVKGTARYEVDARLVESLNLKAEDAIAIIIRQHVQKPCTVKSIAEYRDRNEILLGYIVVVEDLSKTP